LSSNISVTCDDTTSSLAPLIAQQEDARFFLFLIGPPSMMDELRKENDGPPTLAHRCLAQKHAHIAAAMSKTKTI
jgi:hypothetical protein